MDDCPTPPVLSYGQIEQMAVEARGRLWPQDTIPLNIENILERMGIRIDPIANLRGDTSIEASLSACRKFIHIDLQYYNNPRMEPRVRFSFAHELGHLLMHNDLFSFYGKNPPETVFGWALMIQKLHDRYEKIYEDQADDFASCFLIPRHHLDRIAQPIIAQEMARVPAYADHYESFRGHIACMVHRMFHVSDRAMEVRLRKTGLISK